MDEVVFIKILHIYFCQYSGYLGRVRLALRSQSYMPSKKDIG